MKKLKLPIISFFMCLFIFFTYNNLAIAHNNRLVDDANLLSDSEIEDITSKLDEISKRQECDIVIVTTDYLNGKNAQNFADDYYDINNYGLGEDKSGILFLVSMENRDWHISTAGYGITAFTDAGIEYMSKKFLPDLKKGNYKNSFNIFADLCDEFITQAKTDKPYDSGNLPKNPLSIWWMPRSIAIGFVVAFLITAQMKKKLKTVSKKAQAKDYVKKDSLNVTNSNDIFLYSTLRRVPIPKETHGSSTHTSFSGTTHGGSGGKF